ncbi:MAG: ribosome-binding factor A [Ignavibacteriales bacterium CG_4_9_14_3_um_filter_34_10]|nr:MAG: ribosome-binding factor A [Ignavibacteriales bacterium CG_4_9_14_3_um_filter_34_10]
MSIRLDKISALIKDELSLIFLHEINNPDIGFLTITNVKITPDLRNAKIYFSIYEKEKREKTLTKLKEMKATIRMMLAGRVNYLRHIPELDFFLDETLDYVEKIEKLFKEIHKNDNENNN